MERENPQSYLLQIPQNMAFLKQDALFGVLSSLSFPSHMICPPMNKHLGICE